jgi:enoyl-CoA hydratase/carnithine racemase
MNYQYLQISKNKNVVTLRLNRPEKLNALCFAMVEELNHAIKAVDIETTHALFITGNDQAFSAGGDLSEMKNLKQAEAEQRSNYIHETFQLLQKHEIPTLAFISGFCLGGGLELALHCDIRIASDDAKLGLPELQYGIIPGAGGTVQLPNQMGYADAAYYLLTGQNIPVELALQKGLIQQVIASGSLEKQLEKTSAYFNGLQVSAIKAAKKMLRLNQLTDVRTRYQNEAKLFAELLLENLKKGVNGKF